MLPQVRSRAGAPTAADFSSATGTPIVVNTTTGQAHVYANNAVVPIGAVSVMGFGAVADYVVGTGAGTDNTAAFNAAIATGKAVFIPDGSYKITAALTPSTIGQLIYGGGPEQTKIYFTGAGTKGIVPSGSLIRLYLRDFSLVGGTGTSHAIDTSAGLLYTSEFRNIWITSVGKCMYVPDEFNNTYANIQFASSGDNGLEIEGGNTTTLINCYAHAFPAGAYYPYRLYAGAVMISCNGVDGAVGDYMLFAGRAVAKGDPADTGYSLHCIRCNFEDFHKNGVQLRYNGSAIFENCTFLPPATGTYDCSVYIEYCDQSIVFINSGTTSKGATRNKLAEIFSDAGAAPLCIGSYSTWDSNATLTTIPNLVTAQMALARFGLSLAELMVTNQLQTPASTTARAGFRIAHGAAPTAPVDGDMWTTTAGLYVRINGATVGPLS
jgi:hypothetical protein